MLNIEKLASSRPTADHSIEQFLMKPEDLEAQADRIGPFLSGRRVFFLGDDDHMSPILAVRFNVSPVVYEIDPRVRESLVSWFSRLGIKGNVQIYDVHNPVQITPKCGAFYINPPYSSKSEGLGAKIWLMRALEACDPECSGILVLPWEGGSIDETWVDEVQQSVTSFIQNNGVKIMKIDHNSASYSDTNHLGLMSSNLYLSGVEVSKHELIDTTRLYN
jgi:predicted methyltransferase